MKNEVLNPCESNQNLLIQKSLTTFAKFLIVKKIFIPIFSVTHSQKKNLNSLHLNLLKLTR